MIQFLFVRFDDWTDLTESCALCFACGRGYIETVLILQYFPSLSLNEQIDYLDLPLFAA